MTGRRARDYTRETVVHAPVEVVFDAVATLDGVRGWWTPRASGSDRPGGVIRLEFEGLREHIDLRVDAVVRPRRVQWSIVEHTSLEEWAGTKVHFALRPASGGCVLDFRHEGLSPALECYGDCEAGWRHFLGSLATFAERGRGAPFAARRARG